MSCLNTDAEKKDKKREKRWAGSLQSACYAQESKKFVRMTSGSYINSEEFNYYMNGLRES